ncbi:MAG: glycosyltransferase family 2 protein [Ignavibacteriaceae bacterium]
MERKISKINVDVTIIIVNFNAFKLLKDCLNTLYEFTSQINYEVILIDNNSTTGDISKRFGNNKNLKIIKNKKNKGFGAANNQGLELAQGKYVLFLNNDTKFFENTIKKVFDFAETITKPVIIGCKLLNNDKTLQHSVYDFPSLQNIFTSNFFLYALFPKSKSFNKYHLMNQKLNVIKKVDVVTGAFMFCSLDAIKNLGGFDERFFFYNEETDLCFRFVRSGGEVYYYPETALIHLKGGTANKTSWFSIKNQSVSTIKFFQKHFNGYNKLLAITIHYFGLIIRIPAFFVSGLFTLNSKLIKRSFFSIKLLFIYPVNQFDINLK